MKPQDAFSPEVMAELARPVETYDPRHAEMVSDRDPQWHVVETWSRKEQDVVNELAKHRFGVFVPTIESTAIRRGRRVDRVDMMFPGYVFVYLWPSAGNMGRLLNTEGVTAVAGRLHYEQLYLIRVLDKVQSWPIPTRKPRHHAKLVKRRRWEDWLHQLRSLDADRRNQALRKLLGLF